MMAVRLQRGFRAVALAVCATIAGACGDSDTGTPPTGGGTGGTGGGTTSPADVTITINGMNGANSFTPNPGEVPLGQTVAWHNADSLPHTATGSDFDTGTIAAGATSAPIRFDSAATFAYRCTIHPDMTGSLRVGGSDTQIPY